MWVAIALRSSDPAKAGFISFDVVWTGGSPLTDGSARNEARHDVIALGYDRAAVLMALRDYISSEIVCDRACRDLNVEVPQ